MGKCTDERVKPLEENSLMPRWGTCCYSRNCRGNNTNSILFKQVPLHAFHSPFEYHLLHFNTHNCYLKQTHHSKSLKLCRGLSSLQSRREFNPDQALSCSSLLYSTTRHPWRIVRALDSKPYSSFNTNILALFIFITSHNIKSYKYYACMHTSLHLVTG